MSLDQFFVKLAETPRTWMIGRRGVIRVGASGQCPICAVAGDPSNRGDWKQAAKRLRLRVQTGARLAVVADGWGGDYGGRRLRARLLSACGLTEGQ